MSQQRLKNSIILHIAYCQDWETAKNIGFYQAASLESQGFIHASMPSQMVAVANKFYKGQQDLVLLCIDPALLESEVHYESLGTSEAYPHIYGKVNWEAIVKVIDFQPDVKGFFRLPEFVA